MRKSRIKDSMHAQKPRVSDLLRVLRPPALPFKTGDSCDRYITRVNFVQPHELGFFSVYFI